MGSPGAMAAMAAMAGGGGGVQGGGGGGMKMPQRFIPPGMLQQQVRVVQVKYYLDILFRLVVLTSLLLFASSNHL